jgi:hypothetical protein
MENEIEYKEKDEEDILYNLVSSIMKNSKPLNGDFQKFIDDNFFDLV